MGKKQVVMTALCCIGQRTLREPLDIGVIAFI